MRLLIGAAYIPNAERGRTEKAEYWKWLLDAGAKLVSRSAIICGDFNTGMPYVDEKGKTLICSELMGQMLQSQWTVLWRKSHVDHRESVGGRPVEMDSDLIMRSAHRQPSHDALAPNMSPSSMANVSRTPIEVTSGVKNDPYLITQCS
jgi:hypothetical protein